MQFFNLGNTGGAFKFNGVDAITQNPISGVTSFARNESSPDYTNIITEAIDGTTAVITESATGNKTIVAATQDTIINKVVDAVSVQNTSTQLGSLEWSVRNDGNKVFKIGIDGKIGTNQCQTPFVRVTQTFEIPVYNEVGTIKGYIKVFNV